MIKTEIHLNGLGRVVCGRCRTTLKGPVASACEVCKESLSVTGVMCIDAGGSGGISKGSSAPDVKTINKIIATDDRSQIAAAIMQLGAAYSRLVASEEAPNPLMPWARIGDQFFVYTSHRSAADELMERVMRDNVNTYPL